eukprot:COSAG01_NODE_9640_length_2382_cov_2.425756_3_plen_92_part_00
MRGAGLISADAVAAVQRHEDFHRVVAQLVEPILGGVKIGRAIGALRLACRLPTVARAMTVVMDDDRVAASPASRAAAVTITNYFQDQNAST